MLAALAHAYILDRRDTVNGVMLGAWVVTCDAGLKLVARLGGCGDDVAFDASLAAQIWSAPSGCPGTDMAGPSIRLAPHVNEGAILGFGGGLTGFNGQMFALGLLFVATVLTIVVARWRWQANGDPQALGAIWGGAVVSGLPRLLGDGAGVAELQLFGVSAGVGDLALLWGALWLTLRALGELRA